MKKILVLLFATLSTFSLAAGAAGTGATEAGDADKATVVFLRWSMVGAMHRAAVYDVTDGRLEFIGFLLSKTRLSYKVSPGKHTFMVVTEAADFMEAEVFGGKFYYAIATPRIGVVRDRFSLYPIRNDATSKYNTGSSDFREWIRKTDESYVSGRDLDWFEDNRHRAERMRDRYWDDWMDKPPHERAEHTLNPKDGVDEQF